MLEIPTGISFQSSTRQIFTKSLLCARSYNGNWRINAELHQCCPGLPKANILIYGRHNTEENKAGSHPGISTTNGDGKAGGSLDPADIWV